MHCSHIQTISQLFLSSKKFEKITIIKASINTLFKIVVVPEKKSIFSYKVEIVIFKEFIF